MLTKVKNNAFSCTELSRLSAEELYSFSMCAANSKFIYVTGGCNSSGHRVANCHRYDIDRNLWQEMQSMFEPRNNHSSCQLAAHIYVICGMNSQGKKINSVEKLSIDEDPDVQV